MMSNGPTPGTARRNGEDTAVETLTDAMTRLRATGYLIDFSATGDGQLRCGCCGARQDPGTMTVQQTVRFEGDSNPDDEAILFALASACGCAGQYSAAYRPDTPRRRCRDPAAAVAPTSHMTSSPRRPLATSSPLFACASAPPGPWRSQPFHRNVRRVSAAAAVAGGKRLDGVARLRVPAAVVPFSRAARHV